MSVELIRWKRGKYGIFNHVESEFLGDVAAAHHIESRRAIKRVADAGALVARQKVAAHISDVERRGSRKNRDFTFTIERESGDLNEDILLVATPRIGVAPGRGIRKREKALSSRLHGAVIAYEYTNPGVGPLRAAYHAMAGA